MAAVVEVFPPDIGAYYRPGYATHELAERVMAGEAQRGHHMRAQGGTGNGSTTTSSSSGKAGVGGFTSHLGDGLSTIEE